MLGWFKRQEGFEWRNYVRTTILIRREKRRQKLDEARLAALDSLKDAGRKGAEIGAAGIEAASQQARSAGAGLWSLLLKAFGGFAGQLGGAAVAALEASKAGLGKVTATKLPLDGLDLARLKLPLLAIAVVAAAAMTLLYLPRLPLPALDQETGMAVGMGLAALIVLVFATGLPRLGTLRDGLARILATLPDTATIAARLPGATPRTVYTGGAIASLSALLVAGAWLSPAAVVSPSTTRVAEAAAPPAAGVNRIEGRAVVKSGDILRIDGAAVKLAGIEAPDRDQMCQRVGSKPWPCGRIAAEALAKLVKGRDVSCDLGKADAAGNQLATCRIGDADLADQLVRNGHVFAESGLFAAYSSAESAARNAKSGVWSGEIERPSAYRSKRWEEAKRTSPEGCPIKGQVNSGTRVYVLPWSPSYERIKIRAGKGERWFCSEKEAQEAGWKPIERS